MIRAAGSAPDTPGQHGRIGILNPSAGITIEHEWPRMLPEGVSAHVTRMMLVSGTVAELDRMTKAAPAGARMLLSSRIGVLCFGCTIGSVYRGPAGEAELVSTLRAETGLPVVTMARAATAALAALGARRIAMANPYGTEVNALLRAYLGAAGISVAALHTLTLVDSWSITQVSPTAVRELGRAAAREAAECEALFLSCGNLRTIEVIAPLEEELGIPVISSNQAMLWQALGALGVAPGGALPGRLARLAPPPPTPP
jgi:maleate isomerase